MQVHIYVLGLAVLAACEPAPSKLDATLRAAPLGAVIESSTQAASECDRLDRAQCLASTACTLEVAPQGAFPYACRPERGPCETGLVQSDEKACTARAGCRFVPGKCYCECRTERGTKVPDTHGPECVCVCGGGPPPMCVAE